MPDTLAGILAAAEANLVASRRLAAQRLALAYAWAGAHEKPADVPMRGSRRDAGGRLRRLAYRELGATGLSVAEDAPAELGISLGVSSAAARALLAETIDLVHRLPHTWAAIQAGQLEAWVGRKIARLTGELSDTAAGWVDTELAPSLARLPTGRLLSLAEAKVISADRAAADARAEEQRRRHTLRIGRVTQHGTRSLFARCGAADALRLFNLADHLAHVLRSQVTDPTQDTETLDQLRARALGILANPALAVSLLAGTDTDTDENDRPTTATPSPAAPSCAEGLLDSAHLARLSRAMRTHTTLYGHLTPAMLATGRDSRTENAPGPVARAEEIGALTRDLLLRLLGHDHVTVKPVINIAEHLTSDRYEIPAAIAERLHLAKPHDVFPYASCLSRYQDTDHVIPFDAVRAAAGQPQTHLGNLAKLTRHHHRIKTHAPGWRTWQLDETTHLWRTPHGRYRITDRTGTHTVEASDTGPPPRTAVIELWRTPVQLVYEPSDN